MNKGVAGSGESGRGTGKQTEGNREEEESTESPRGIVKQAETNRGKEESTESSRGIVKQAGEAYTITTMQSQASRVMQTGNGREGQADVHYLAHRVLQSLFLPRVSFRGPRVAE